MQIQVQCKLALILMLIGMLLAAFPIEAAEKTWSGSGDASSWSDDDNWFPQVEPTAGDDVLIDAEDVSVTCSETFKAKSISIGGNETSTLISENFIFGTISPEATSDVAIDNRQGGTFRLKGAGIVTLQGQYKDSLGEGGVSVDEPSFMFWLE